MKIIYITRLAPQFATYSNVKLPHVSQHFSPGGEIITLGFEFARNFIKEWNNSVYFELNMSLWI